MCCASAGGLTTMVSFAVQAALDLHYCVAHSSLQGMEGTGRGVNACAAGQSVVAKGWEDVLCFSWRADNQGKCDDL
jgi:hypothetical protein